MSVGLLRQKLYMLQHVFPSDSWALLFSSY